MKATYRNLMSLLLLTSAAVGMTSCAYESADEAVKAPRNGNVVLNIHTTGVGDDATRGATTISGTSGTTLTDDEKKMHTLTVGLFKASTDATGTTLDIKSPSITGGTDANSTQSINTTYAAGATATPEANDIVRVAINVPTAVDLAAKTSGAWDKATEGDFKNTTLDIDQALAFGGSDVDAAKLPMTGNSTMSFNTTTDQWESSVTVYHLVAKVTLAQLTVDFTGTTHTSATFKPTEIFLTGVPDKINLDMTDGVYAFSQGTYSKYYQGESDNTTDQKDYLGTGTGITEKTLSSSQTTYGSLYTLYTLPNKNDVTTTCLVIKGEYSSDGQAWNAHTRYYKIPLGKATEDQVKANVHYVVTATIKGDGAAEADDEHPGTQDLDVTVTATDFDDESVTATFTNSGNISYEGQRDPVVGDLYFNDGSWGTQAEMPNKTPIGIVFKVGTTAADQALGYKYGYVMALKKANSDQALSSGWGTDPNIAAHQLGFDLAKVKADYDGLTHCKEAYANNSNSYSGLHAMKAAAEYEVAAPTPSGSYTNSGWYLPSIGQQYLWLIEFTQVDDAAANAKVTESTTWNPSSNNNYWTAASTDSKEVCKTINAYVKAKLSTDVNKALYQDFNEAGGDYLWSSSWRIAGYPFSLNFNASGYLNLNGNTDSGSTNRRVRAVLAF